MKDQRARYRFIILKILIALLVMNCIAMHTQAEAQETTKKILFVCTGNYYRSRFAEAYFNWRANNLNLPWQAISRGFRPEPGRPGISPFAQQQLTLRGVPSSQRVSDPQQLVAQDLLGSDYVVILDQKEHQPMMARQFPGLALPNLHYWQIRDYPFMQAPEACSSMAEQIDRLVMQLKREKSEVPLPAGAALNPPR